MRNALAMVICKNVLLHFHPQQRVKVLQMFHDALRKDGLLVMEHTQKLPEELLPLFQQVSPSAQVFKKIGSPAIGIERTDSGATRRVDLPGGGGVPYRRDTVSPRIGTGQNMT